MLQNIEADLRFDRFRTVEPLGQSGGLIFLFMNENQIFFIFFSNNRMNDIEAIIYGIKKFHAVCQRRSCFGTKRSSVRLSYAFLNYKEWNLFLDQ